MKLTNLANTIAQYKILEYIQESFNPEAFVTGLLRIEMIDYQHVKLIDPKEELIFSYDEETKQVEWEQ